MIPDTVSDTGLALIKKFEGLRLQSYLCPANVWTIGYGHTKGVQKGQTITEDEAHAFLAEDVMSCVKAIKRYVKVALNQHQLDALASFVFNLGEGNFASSTLLKKLNRAEYQAVPAELNRWNKARVNGKLVALKGLTRRRSAEAALWAMDTPLTGNGGDPMPQRVSAASTVPLTKSRTMWGLSLTAIAAIVDQFNRDISAFAGAHAYVDIALSVLQVSGIVIAAYARYDDHVKGKR